MLTEPLAALTLSPLRCCLLRASNSPLAWLILAEQRVLFPLALVRQQYETMPGECRFLDMKTFEIQFTGRKKGAIGVFHKIIAQVFADDEQAAILALYDRWEHIQQPTAKEIPSPFDSDTLINRIQNTQEEHKLIRLYVERLRDCVYSFAQKQARDNAQWHDDPDSEDHALYHAPTDQQFQREEQDKAILELVSRHLEVINENENALVQQERESRKIVLTRGPQ